MMKLVAFVATMAGHEFLALGCAQRHQCRNLILYSPGNYRGRSVLTRILLQNRIIGNILVKIVISRLCDMYGVIIKVGSLSENFQTSIFPTP